jgi:hypothetical protein
MRLLRIKLAGIMAAAGSPVKKTPADQSQAIDIRFLQAFMGMSGDPESYVFDWLATGVWIGVDKKLPRTPAIFEAKTKWALEEKIWDPDSEGKWADNYVSAKEHPEALEKQFLEDEREGMMKRMPVAEAQALYPKKLCIAAQGALAKALGSDEFRIIHDGTNKVEVNRAIRVRDQLRNPTHHEGTRLLQEMAQDDSHFHFSLMVDVRKAHRRVAVREDDWPYQACKARDTDEHLFLNCVGTFGIASAGYWWGRLYAAVTRAIHYGLGSRYMLWALSYADDTWMVGRGPDAFRALQMALLLMTVFNIPFTWGKVRGGF